MKDKTEQLFLQWFVEQYDCGLPDEWNFRMCVAYLQGLLDAQEPGSQRFVQIRSCISCLTSAETMVRALKMEQVKLHA